MTGIPAGISTALVHLDAPVSFVGDDGRLYVTITPSIPLIWTETGTPVANFIDSRKLDPGVPFEVRLPHTDQDGFQDGFGNTITGWYYTVKVIYEKGGQRIAFPLRDFQVLVGQLEVDLALVPSGGAAPVPQIAPILPVTDIAGLNGSVTLAELGLDVVSILTPHPVYPGLYTLSSAPTPDMSYDGGTATTTYTNPSDSIIDGGIA